MRHSHHDLRRQLQRKLDASFSRRKRLVVQRDSAAKGIEDIDRLTKPLVDALVEIDAQLSSGMGVPAALVVNPAPAATSLLGQGPMRVDTRPKLRVEGLWKP